MEFDEMDVEVDELFTDLEALRPDSASEEMLESMQGAVYAVE